MIRDFQKALRTAVFHRNLGLWTPGEYVSPCDRFSETCIVIRWVDKEKNGGSCSFLDREWFSFVLLSLIFLLNLSNIHHEGAKKNMDSFFFPGISCCRDVFYQWKCTRRHSMHPQSPSCRGGKSHQYLKTSTLLSSATSLFFHPSLQSPGTLALHNELFSPLVCPFPVWAIKERLLFFFSSL